MPVRPCGQNVDCVSNMCSGGSCVVTNWASCQAVKNANPAAKSGVYSLTISGKMYSVWCEIIDNNGWTLVLTADGNDNRWHYDNVLWSNMLETNPDAYVNGLSHTSFKSLMYWLLPFTQIRVGMKTMYVTYVRF